MNKIIRINVSLLVLTFLIFSVQAQKTGKKLSSTKMTDTTVNVPKTKTEKAIADADNYTKMADDVKVKVKNLFPVKAGDTVYFVIPGISYMDPNLKLFKQKLDNVKNTKGLTSSYRNNTAIVKILFKGGDASRLYDNLDDALKELFMAEDMEGNRAILNYKMANQTEPATDIKNMAATKSK
jgi:prophage DNA circulation protein